MHVSFTGAGRDALDHALARAPWHWRPLLKAVRDEGCGLMLIAQGRERFVVPPASPQIVVLGDDLAAALGPGAFHERSLRRFLPRVGAAAIMSCEPIAQVYWEVCKWAIDHREDVTIIETRPEREAEWLALLRRECPKDVALAVGTVQPEGRPQ